MKHFLLKTAGAFSMLALMATGGFAQDKKKETNNNVNRDVIVIKPKTNVSTKLTIEIKGDDVKVNGKPVSEFKSSNLTITTESDDVTVSGYGEVYDRADRAREVRLRTTNGKRLAETEARLYADNERLAELKGLQSYRTPMTRFKGGTTVYGYGISDNGNKAFLGIGSENIDGEDGIRVTSVSKESGAEKAGLKEGDVIMQINDSKINSPEELTKTIGKFNPDNKVNIVYKRDNKEQKATATLTKRKSTGAISYSSADAFDFKKFDLNGNGNYNFTWNGKPRLGLKAQETEDGKGLKVLEVDDESTAEKAGIKEGDIITSFDGSEVNNIDKLRELSEPALTKGNFKVVLTRDGKSQEVEVKIPKKLKTTSL